MAELTECERHVLIKKILRILNERKVRATYSAVGCVLETHPVSVGKKYLGCPRPEASWVVTKGDGKPSRKAGYKKRHYHPDLIRSSCIIKSCCKLRKWLGLSPVSEHGYACDGADS